MSFTHASIGAMQDDCEEALLVNKTYWKATVRGIVQPRTDLGTMLCPNLCSNRGECDGGKCVCDLGYTSADCSIEKGVAPRIATRAIFCDIRTRDDCHFLTLIGENFIDSPNLSCRAKRTEVYLTIFKLHCSCLFKGEFFSLPRLK